MTNSYIQVPPDSVGKKMFAKQNVVGADTVHTQVMHVADANDPTKVQQVDIRGQAYVRFAEGSPTMDAFANLRVGTAHILGGYEYTNTDMADLFQDKTGVGGTLTWNQTAANTVMAVNSTSGSFATRTTNRYHYYQPGVGNLVILTIANGDAGKANNFRRWGYFDVEDGIFFELNGTTLSVILRSSVSGSIVEERIPQESWNGDKLDGTGMSGMTIDVTMANFYFIDYAWLGVGPVRFGVLAPDGSRWVCHTFHNPNTRIGAYMRTGSLPVRYENTNTGATASTSELKVICTAIYSESETNYTYWRYSDIERITPVTVGTKTPLLSMRVKPGSRVGIYPEKLSILVTGTGGARVSIIDDAVLTGATWGITGGGEAQGDIGATAATGGEAYISLYVPEGVTNLDLREYYETNDEGYHRLADDSDSYTFTVVITKLAASVVTAGAMLGYKELA